MQRFKTRLAQLEQRQARRKDSVTLRVVCRFPHTVSDVVLLDMVLDGRLRVQEERPVASRADFQAACEA